MPTSTGTRVAAGSGVSVGDGIKVGVSVGAATVGVGALLEIASVGAAVAGAELVAGKTVGVTVGILSVIT